jgi:hypothetical protein
MHLQGLRITMNTLVRKYGVRMAIQSDNFQNTSQINSSLEAKSLGNNLGDAGLHINSNWLYITAANWYYQCVKSPPESIHLKNKVLTRLEEPFARRFCNGRHPQYGR